MAVLMAIPASWLPMTSEAALRGTKSCIVAAF